MTVKEKSIWEQIKDLGANTNILYEIGGALDNLKVLSDVVDEKLDDLQKQLERTGAAPFILNMTKDIRQLMFVVEDEHKRAEKHLDELIKQVDG